MKTNSTKSNFTQVENSLLRSPDLSPTAKVLYSVIASYNPSYPSYTTLMTQVNVAKATLSKAIQELVRFQIIDYVQGSLKSKKSNLYRIRPVTDWKLVNPSVQNLNSQVKSSVQKLNAEDESLGSEIEPMSVQNLNSNNTNNNNKAKENEEMKPITKEQQDILNQALAIPANRLTKFEAKFIADIKAATRLSDKQANILKQIAKKTNTPANPPVPQPPLKTLTRDLLDVTYQQAASVEQLITGLQEYSFKNADKVLTDLLNKNFFELKFNNQNQWEQIAAALSTKLPDDIQEKIDTFSHRYNQRRSKVG